MDMNRLRNFLAWLFVSEERPVYPQAPEPASRTITKGHIRADAIGRALKAYQAGRDFRHLIAGHHLYEIKQWISMGLATRSSKVRVVVQTVDRAHEPACAACAALEGHVFTIAEVLEKLPLPVAGCTHKVRKTKDPEGWCRCDFELTELG